MSGENYRSTSKSHEPGWNDPPKVAYIGSSAAAGIAGGPPTKAALNKRVAFPLQHRVPPSTSELCQPGSGQPASGPPLNHQPAHGPPSLMISGEQKLIFPQEQKEENSEEMPADREEMFGQVRAGLDGCVGRMEECRREEIQKRINMIYESWTAGKLPQGLEKHIHSLANALVEMDVARASGIHRSIICDYGSKCALWAPALRQLVFALPQPTDEPHETNVIAKPI